MRSRDQPGFGLGAQTEKCALPGADRRWATVTEWIKVDSVYAPVITQ